MRRRLFTPSEHQVECRHLTLAQARELEPIPSGYETQRVYRLRRRERGGSISWELYPERLNRPYAKLYDNGRIEEWLEAHGDAGSPDDFRFIAAWRDESLAGLLTWRISEWNHSVWLIDIRSRQEVRRSGVGSALVDELKRQTAIVECRGISVETQINNYPAVSFYLKHNFRISGLNDHLYSNNDLADQDVALFLFWEAGEG